MKIFVIICLCIISASGMFIYVNLKSVRESEAETARIKAETTKILAEIEKDYKAPISEKTPQVPTAPTGLMIIE